MGKEAKGKGKKMPRRKSKTVAKTAIKTKPGSVSKGLCKKKSAKSTKKSVASKNKKELITATATVEATERRSTRAKLIAVVPHPRPRRGTVKLRSGLEEVDVKLVEHQQALEEKVTRKESRAKVAPAPVEKTGSVEGLSPPAKVVTDTNTPPEDDNAPMSPGEYSNVVWDLIDSYFVENRGLQSQAIASFNHFISVTMPSIVKTCGKTSVEHALNNACKIIHSVEMGKVYMEKQLVHKSPDGRFFPLYPHEARNRNLTYSSQLCVDIRHTVHRADIAGHQTLIKDLTHPVVQIADVPIMIKSELCRLSGLTLEQITRNHEDPKDPGGYFIINGKEKVIVTQERPANNQLFLFKPTCDSKYQYECEIRSTTDSNTDKVSALWIHIPGNPKSYSTFKESKFRIAQRGALAKDNVRKRIEKQFNKLRPGLVVTIATVRGPVPLLILFKALGFETDGEIMDTFLVDRKDNDFYEALRTSMEDPTAQKIKGKQEALAFIGSRSFKEPTTEDEAAFYGRKVINDEVLPALGCEVVCDRLKGHHIGYMVNRLVFAYLGRIHCDDRDHLKNKRFDMAGSMLASLFKSQIRSLMNETRLGILRRIKSGLDFDLERNIIRQGLVTKGLIYGMTSGNWGDRRRGSTGRVGVSQLVNRLTEMATVSYLRRINSPTNRLVRMVAPRHCHTTGFGYICPADTPEGETIGLLKCLSVMAEVSTDVNKQPILECLSDVGYDKIEDGHDKLATDTKIIIDSEIYGTCPRERVAVIMEMLKQRRREFDEVKEIKRDLERIKHPEKRGEYRGFSNVVSIVHDPEYREIRIRTDAGRAYRPLLVVKNNQLLLTKRHIKRLKDPADNYCWKNLIQDGVIEYLDPAESETAMMAMFPGDLDGSSGRHMTYVTKFSSRPHNYKVTYTHCEIHPSMILGVCASLIPFPDHNQSPRNTYQSGMAKQAIGLYVTNFHARNDTEGHVLHYPQRPLVTTKTAKFIKYDDNPAGINCITAICCFSGYNQEDSVILNKSAVQRGLFRSTLYRTKQEEAKVSCGRGDMDEQFEIPRKGQVGIFRNCNYAHLEADGLPAAGTLIQDGDPIIGKTQYIGAEMKQQMKSHGRKVYEKTDISVMFRSSAASVDSFVDSVMLTNNPEGYVMVKVKMRTPRAPQIGDKFASRHGQKGVCGMDFEEVDLPFTKDGLYPDIILNPHAIPSRMTIGHLLETTVSKRSCLEGRIADGTCFTKRASVEETGRELEKMGFHKYGMEVMYNGATGRKMQSQVFIGPVFYQRLKHMVEDKMRFRARGPVTELTRQPTGGLQREGGLRFGEMERDSTISHGAAAFLQERLFTVSDYNYFPVCLKCGNYLSKPRRGQPNDYVVHLKCHVCKEPTGAATVELPSACKLFFQELMSMNIKVVMHTEPTARDKPTPASNGQAVEVAHNVLLDNLLEKMDEDVSEDCDD